MLDSCRLGSVANKGDDVAIQFGILDDSPGAPQGELLRAAVSLGIEDVRATAVGASLPAIEVVVHSVVAHPAGSADAAAEALRDLAGTGVIGVIGPAISDNALVCVPVADELRLPCINFTGSERARSQWMFHYQVGSLEDEPFVIAEHLASQGLRRVALVREDSIIGHAYGDFFEDAAVVNGLEIAGAVDIDVQGSDAAAATAAVRDLAPDAVAYFGFVHSAAALATAMVGLPYPVAANSALLIGHYSPEARAAFEGWSYIDVYDEANPERQRFLSMWPDAPTVSSVAMFDMARLMAFGLAHAPSSDRAGLCQGLERVKRIPTALGEPGTLAGFGQWKRAALEGGYLVLRQWRGGESVLIGSSLKSQN